MADISKTAGKVVYEYYFATQGAQRMNAPKSLKSKAKKNIQDELDHAPRSSMMWNSAVSWNFKMFSVDTVLETRGHPSFGG